MRTGGEGEKNTHKVSDSFAMIAFAEMIDECHQPTGQHAAIRRLFLLKTQRGCCAPSGATGQGFCESLLQLSSVADPTTS